MRTFRDLLCLFFRGVGRLAAHPHSAANLGFSFWAWLCSGAFLFCPPPLGAPSLVRLRAAFLVLEGLNSQSTGSGEEHEAVSGELGS